MGERGGNKILQAVLKVQEHGESCYRKRTNKESKKKVKPSNKIDYSNFSKLEVF